MLHGEEYLSSFQRQIYIAVSTVRSLGRVAQSVQGLARGWTVWGSNSGGARFSAPVQNGHRAHTTFCTMGTASFPEIKSDRGVTLTPKPFLVPW
jgi:hypothetical protein